MGLLSRLPFGLQAMSPWAQFGQNQGAMSGIPGVVPFAPQQPQEGGQPGGPFSMSPPNKPGGGLSGTMQGWGDRLNTWTQSPLFSLGMSLLGNAQGSRWDQVGVDMREVGNQQMLRQRMANEDRRLKVQEGREGTVFDRQQTEWRNADQTRAAWEAAVAAETDPQRQQMLRAMGPDGFGPFMAQESNRAFQAEQAALDRQNNLSVAGMRLTGANRPPDAGRYWMRPTGRDDMMMQDYEGSLQNARSALRGIDRLERLFGEMIQRDAQGRPLPASMRMSMSRLMQINPEARAAYEQIQSQVWPMVLQNLEGLAPVTEVELGQALARTVNADMTPEAALAELRRMREEAQYAQDLSLRAFEFANDAGSIGRGRNDEGQNWATYSGGIERPAVETRNEQAARAPQRGETRVVNGVTWRYVGGDPGQQSSWVRVNGGGTEQYRRPDGPMRRG